MGRWIAVALGVLPIVSGCQRGDCILIHEEDLLHLDGASDSETGEPLNSAVITEVRFEGGAGWIPGGGSRLTDLGEGGVRCWFPCSLETFQEGVYEIDISADGHQATTWVVDAVYESFEGGCPAYLDDGTHVSGTLDPL